MLLVHWGSIGDRYGQITLTDASEADFAHHIYFSQGNHYGIFHVTPLSDADAKKLRAQSIPYVSKNDMKLRNL